MELLPAQCPVCSMETTLPWLGGASVSCRYCGTTVFVGPSGGLSVGTHLDLARTFLVAGNLTVSRVQLIKVLEVDPNSRYVWFLHALATALAGSVGEANIYLTRAATTPQEAGGWLSSLLPAVPNPLAEKILEFSPGNGVWRGIVNIIIDLLSTRAGGESLRRLVGYSETALEAAAAAGKWKDAAWGYLSLAEKFGRGDPRTIPYLERAIQIAGDNAKVVLDDWKLVTGYTLDKLGWPPVSSQPPNDEPELKRKAQ